MNHDCADSPVGQGSWDPGKYNQCKCRPASQTSTCTERVRHTTLINDEAPTIIIKYIIKEYLHYNVN